VHQSDETEALPIRFSAPRTSLFVVREHCTETYVSSLSGRGNQSVELTVHTIAERKSRSSIKRCCRRRFSSAAPTGVWYGCLQDGSGSRKPCADQKSVTCHLSVLDGRHPGSSLFPVRSPIVTFVVDYGRPEKGRRAQDVNSPGAQRQEIRHTEKRSRSSLFSEERSLKFAPSLRNCTKHFSLLLRTA